MACVVDSLPDDFAAYTVVNIPNDAATVRKKGKDVFLAPIFPQIYLNNTCDAQVLL
jgi:hypothetical protein